MSSSGIFGPTPKGIDLSETQNTAIMSAVISLMIIATIFVFLRIFARTMQKGITLAVDDYCIALGLVSLAPSLTGVLLTIKKLLAHGTAICCLVSM